ncbi:MAG: hypothetical protein HKP12_00840 [Gammaproteobacteria bacterium]|nr:hypothetical protein [Gammaproteobacteria bacterium]
MKFINVPGFIADVKKTLGLFDEFYSSHHCLGIAQDFSMAEALGQQKLSIGPYIGDCIAAKKPASSATGF